MRIDNEFRALIPPLTSEEYAQLEKSLQEEGCRDALVTWQGILVDGHNRYEICNKHGIAFKSIEKGFANREKAKEWIILNQFGRRNLSAYDRSLLALKLKELFHNKAKENQGARTDLTSVRILTNVDTKKELAQIAGVSHDTISRVEKIEEKAPPEVKAKIKSGELSINKAYTDIVRVERREKVQEELRETVLPVGEFNVLLADPPWRYDFAETDNRAIENQYPTMDVEEIKAMKVPSATNSVLFLWATAPKLLEAIAVMQSWGFAYKTNAVWDKELIGMGYWFRGQHELLLVGTKGTFPPPAPEKRISSVIRERRTAHSKKPPAFYEIIEGLAPNGRYLELFARENNRPGWAAWGNQHE
jgi:N6-adenosine-specific RNA methylase IME4/DNA-binding XRE family transcriptional regulator